MIQLVGVSIEGDIYVSEALFLSDLSENHTCELVPALKMPRTIVPFVLVHDALELVSRK
jgi:hypothetical protein